MELKLTLKVIDGTENGKTGMSNMWVRIDEAHDAHFIQVPNTEAEYMYYFLKSMYLS